MGNIVLKIPDSDRAASDGDKSLEVYRDVSIISDRRTMTVVDYEHRPSAEKASKLFIAKDVNVKAVFNSLRNIFTWIQGERILNPDFGSKLKLYLYEGITDTNKEQIAAEVRGLCLKWEPRVNVISVRPVQSVQNDEDNTVQLDIVFTIPSLSNEQYQYSYIYNRIQ